MDVGNVRLRSPIKCKDIFLILEGEEGWRVDAVGVKGRPPIKYKDRVLEYLRERRYGDLWRVVAVDVRGRPFIKM